MTSPQTERPEGGYVTTVTEDTDLTPGSWLQPPIALYAPTTTPDTWLEVDGVTTCSSSTEVYTAPDSVADEIRAWASLSGEAFAKFERSLDE